MRIKIVIAGAGFGGLSLAYQLKDIFSKKSIDILVIDKKSSFTYFPSVHEIISENVTKDDISIDLRTHLSKRDIDFLHDEIVSVEPGEKSLQTARKKKITFDFLVISMGSVPNYLGIEGAKEHTIPLKSVKSAEKINYLIKEKIKEKRKASIVVCGAGLTGVEGAFAIKDLVDKLDDLYGILDKTEITVVEAMNSVLPPFPSRVQRLAEQALLERKIDVKKGIPIVRISKETVELKNGEKIKADIVIWTVGVRPSPSLSLFELELGQKGGVIVNSHLQSKKYEFIYCLGDSMSFPLDEKRSVPMTAQYAEQQANVAAKNIERQIKDARLADYSPNRNNSVLISLGAGTAIFSKGSFSLKSGIFIRMKKALERKILKKYA